MNETTEELVYKPFFGEIKPRPALIGEDLEELSILPFVGRVVVNQNHGIGFGHMLHLRLPQDFTETIYLFAGVSQETRAGWYHYKSQHPSFYVEMTGTMKELINSNCVYSADEKHCFYLEVVQDGRMFLNYEKITGGRYLGRLTAGAVSALKSLCAGALMEILPKEQPQEATQKMASPEGVLVADGVLAELCLMIIDGQKVVLPEVQLLHYQEIKLLMEKAGGKYNRGCFFSFPAGINPKNVLQTLLAGKKINVQQETQSFFSPPGVANKVCAAIGDFTGKRILEPSGGGGALADIARQRGAEVVVVENHPVNIKQLLDKGYNVIERDFLTVTPDEIGLFDGVIANPPFSRNQDILHVNHMWKFLKPTGILSSVTSRSWIDGTQKAQKAFAKFLKEQGAKIDDIDAGAFKESGTTVPTAHVVLQRHGC